MPRRSKSDTDVRITVAAGFFATHTRDAQEIADMLNTSKRNIYRWSKEPLWERVLETLGYEGERNFRTQPARDPQRDDETFEIVKNAYIAARESGIPKHKRISTVCSETGVKVWKVGEWVRKFGWND